MREINQLSKGMNSSGIHEEGIKVICDVEFKFNHQDRGTVGAGSPFGELREVGVVEDGGAETFENGD